MLFTELQKKGNDKMEMPFEPNEGKNLTIDTDFGTYARYPIRTHVIMKEDVIHIINVKMDTIRQLAPSFETKFAINVLEGLIQKINEL
jgi:hypothetical protein